MRAKEFLLEYRRDITARTFAPGIVDWARQDRTIPQGFRNPQVDPDELVDMILSQLEQADPTANKEYTPWLAKMYASGSSYLEDMLSTAKEYLTKFHKLKKSNKLPSPRNDIMRYTDLGDFYSVMDEYSDADEKPLTDKGQAVEIYEDKNIRVIEPEDQAAACYYGQGTRWCTAATKGHNYFDQYNDQAPLMIVIPKKPAYPGEKYQLWFWYGADGLLFGNDSDYLELYHEYGEDWMVDNQELGQFMNEKDQDVGLRAVMKRFGTSLNNAIEAYIDKNPHLAYAVQTNFEHEGIK